MNTATEAAGKAESSWVSAASGSLPSLAQLVCAGGALLVVLTFTAQRRRWTASDGAKPPATPRKIHSPGTKIPLIGDLLLFTRNAHRKHDFFTEMCLRFNGEPWQGHIIGMPTFVHFTDPRAIEEITTTQFDNFAKGPFQLDVVRDLLGNSIVASDGERWYHQRKTAMKFFSARALRDCMQHTMKRNVKLMIAAIEKQRGANELVDLLLLFHQFTLQTFAETGLGVEIPLIGQQEANAFEQALDTAMPIMSRRGRLPPFVWKLERWLGVGQEKLLAESLKTIRGWLHETIEHGLASIRKQPHDGDKTAHGQSILELFVQYSGDEIDGMKPEDLRDFILNFVIAARDTSALTLSWFFYALGKHPEVVAKIRREMAQKLSPGTDFLTSDDAKRLTYLEAAIKETVRLYPGGPHTVKQVMRDTVICGDIFLRKGMMISINAWAVARNPRVWGPDASEFKPQRWINETTGEIIQVPVYKFVSFHAGPRSCAGRKLAMLNLRVVTANLLHRFAFDIDPANDGSYVNAPTLAMKHALLATATPIGIIPSDRAYE